MDLIFDGHNDALSRLWCASSDPVADFARDIGHVNVPAARQGGLAGGFFALYSPRTRAPFDFSAFLPDGDAVPMADAIDPAEALAAITAQTGLAHQLAALGHITICTTGSALEAALDKPELAVLLHLEGADGIDQELLALDTLYAAGLRSLGPVWSRPNAFGHGVPFAWGRDGDTGPGLTEAGLRLVARCKALGVIVDTSHLTARGFWQIGEAGLPLVATHSNAFAVAPATRNLTDDQLRAIGETGGIAGLNFGTVFLSEQGWKTGREGIEVMLRHLDHMIALAGEDCVALGSDFDGAPMPQGITSAADLPALIAAMRAADYGEPLIAKLTRGNWLAFLTRELG